MRPKIHVRMRQKNLHMRPKNYVYETKKLRVHETKNLCAYETKNVHPRQRKLRA